MPHSLSALLPEKTEVVPAADRSFPFYLTQDRVDGLAMLLYKHQTLVNVISPNGSLSEEAFCFLTELRQQCCERAGASDPFPDLPMTPSFEEECN